MPNRIAAWTMLLLALAFAGPAGAQSWLADPSEPGKQTAEVGSAKLTLPPGTWELVSERGQGSNNANAIAWMTRVYLQVLDGKVGAILALGSNASAATGRRSRWRVPNQCGIKNATYIVSDAKDVDNAYGTYDCMLVTFTVPSTDASDALMGPVIQRAAALGGLPKGMLYASFAKTSQSREDSVQVEMFVNTGTPSFLAAVMASGINTVKPTAGQVLTAMTAWAAGYRPTVAASMP